MEPTALIPVPDSIPAPAWLFLVLEVLLFTLHLLLINVILGGSLIILLARLKGPEEPLEHRLHSAMAAKIPTTFALGVNLGVAPLLFLQVVYGHLFYASSVLMAVYWILVIPFLILAYYGAYIHIRKYASAATLSRVAIGTTAVLVLYIGFMFVNNMTLMLQPEKWSVYFDERGGTILNLSDPTLIPRYLHFVAASVAIAGLFAALVWSMRQEKYGPRAEAKIRSGLQIFGGATIVQVVVGLWFLLAIPREFLLQFMGGDRFATIVFMVGFLSGIGTIATAFANKLRPTLSMLILTILAMVITRHNLRSMYLEGKFDPASLQLAPQYSVMILFFAVLIIGLIAVGYMLKLLRSAGEGSVAR